MTEKKLKKIEKLERKLDDYSNENNLRIDIYNLKYTIRNFYDNFRDINSKIKKEIDEKDYKKLLSTLEKIFNDVSLMYEKELNKKNKYKTKLESLLKHCDHTYPNGESAFENGFCLICGVEKLGK